MNRALSCGGISARPPETKPETYDGLAEYSFRWGTDREALQYLFGDSHDAAEGARLHFLDNASPRGVEEEPTACVNPSPHVLQGNVRIFRHGGMLTAIASDVTKLCR